MKQFDFLILGSGIAGLSFALKAAPQPEPEAPFALPSTQKILLRLQALAYPDDPGFDFELLTGKPPQLISTMPDSAYDIEYTSARKRAWRNLMVCAINAGLTQKLFSLRPGDNRFANEDGGGQLFDFVLPNGLPARGWVGDAGFDGVVIRLAMRSVSIHRSGELGVVSAAAGVVWDELVARAIEAGLAGLECLSGIPGQIGRASCREGV